MSKALLHSWLVIVVAAAAVSLVQTSTGKSPIVGAIVMPADAMKWQQVRSGQESAPIWGDRSSSAYGALNRFAGGFDDRPHAHTRDLRGLVVSGTMVVRVAPFLTSLLNEHARSEFGWLWARGIERS